MTLDLAAIEADLQRQLDRTRRMPTEPMISIRAETLRGLIAAAKETEELRESAQLWEEQAFHWEKRCALIAELKAKTEPQRK